MNCDKLLIINKIFGYVKNKYYNEQSTYRYYVWSIVELLSYNLSDSVEKSEMMTFLTFYMLIYNNTSRIYFFWDKKKV